MSGSITRMLLFFKGYQGRDNISMFNISTWGVFQLCCRRNNVQVSLMSFALRSYTAKSYGHF